MTNTTREPIREGTKKRKNHRTYLPLLQSNGVTMQIPKQEGYRAFWEHQMELFGVRWMTELSTLQPSKEPHSLQWNF